MRFNLLEQKMWEKAVFWLCQGSWEWEVRKLLEIKKNYSWDILKDVTVNHVVFFSVEKSLVLMY